MNKKPLSKDAQAAVDAAIERKRILAYHQDYAKAIARHYLKKVKKK